MGAIPSRENPDTIFSLRYGGHEIGLVPLLRRYFNDNNREMKRQFIRVWNDPSVRYHYPQSNGTPVTLLPPPMYTEDDLEAFLDVVEKDLFDTNEEFMQASMEAAEYYASREREESNRASGSSMNPDTIAAFMSGLRRKDEPSGSSTRDVDRGVVHPGNAGSLPGNERGSLKDKDPAVAALNFPTFDAFESLESSTANLVLPHCASSGGMSVKESQQNLIPSSLLLESFNDSSNILDGMTMESRGKERLFKLPERGESRLSNGETEVGGTTEKVFFDRFLGQGAGATASPGIDGRAHLTPHNVNIPADANTSKLEESVVHSEIAAPVAKARRCKRAIRPVPCAVLFVYVSGRKESDCFSFCGRKANVIGYFGCRAQKDESDDDVPYLQLYNIVLKAAGDRTVERVLILAARLYVEQYRQILVRSMPDVNPIHVFQQRYEAVRMLVSALWNNYPTLKFVYDTAALLWAMNDIGATKSLPSLIWHEDNQQQRLLIRLDGKVVSRVWLWMSNLASMHMQRGNWMQFVLNDFTQYKDKFVANWLESSEAAAYFLQDREFTTKVQQHLDQLHKEILRARETPQSDTTQWSDQQERSYDGKLYRIFLSPHCGPFLTTVKSKEIEEPAKGGFSTSGNLDSWAGFPGHGGEGFSDSGKGPRAYRKGMLPYFKPVEAGGVHGKDAASPATRDAATSYAMDPTWSHAGERGGLPLPPQVTSMGCFIPSASAGNVFMTTQLPMNHGAGVFSMPLLHGAAPAMWDLSVTTPSEKTFSSLPGGMSMATPSGNPANPSVPVLYYSGVNPFTAVAAGRGNGSPQPLPPPAATEGGGGEGQAPVSTPLHPTPVGNSGMYFVSPPPPPTMDGGAGGGAGGGGPQTNLGVFTDANARGSEPPSFSMPPVYPIVGEAGNVNSVPSYPAPVPVMYTHGLPLYPSGQPQVPVFPSNYVMLSDGRIMTTF
ncbi:unnamed protein product [Phytomonas sp. EM1]|nr:unnamed protein product [Phytomonas sp. EM1]|eukprot:CCW59838.1 unnamed protein product [Phytomonas sp. isolate EM1]